MSFQYSTSDQISIKTGLPLLPEFFYFQAVKERIQLEHHLKKALVHPVFDFNINADTYDGVYTERVKVVEVNESIIRQNIYRSSVTVEVDKQELEILKDDAEKIDMLKQKLAHAQYSVMKEVKNTHLHGRHGRKEGLLNTSIPIDASAISNINFHHLTASDIVKYILDPMYGQVTILTYGRTHPDVIIMTPEVAQKLQSTNMSTIEAVTAEGSLTVLEYLKKNHANLFTNKPPTIIVDESFKTYTTDGHPEHYIFAISSYSEWPNTTFAPMSDPNAQNAGLLMGMTDPQITQWPIHNPDKYIFTIRQATTPIDPFKYGCSVYAKFKITAS